MNKATDERGRCRKCGKLSWIASEDGAVQTCSECGYVYEVPSEAVELYVPGESLDEHSKLSYLEHVSYRLKLPERLPCTKTNKEGRPNGVLNTDELRTMATVIIQFERGVDTNNAIERAQFLNDLRIEMEGRSNFSFIVKPWEKFTKTQLGMVIAATLRFQYDGDPHIGTNNGVIYLRFYEDIYDKLPDPDTQIEFEFNEEHFEAASIKRNVGISKKNRTMTAPELNALLGDESAKGITVPEYQRSNQQWTGPKWRAMVHSMLLGIPMPSIVLGRTEDRDSDPWQLVDGHQRLSTIRRFMDDEHHEHFDFHGFEYDELPGWARKRFDSYEFVVERVEAKSDAELAQLYSLYNSSGKPMTPVQIRVARWHEVSPLHHLLLALAGGPMLMKRPGAKERLRITESIQAQADRTKALRKLLPRVGELSEDERLQLRQVTEGTYDKYCKTVAYAIYHRIGGWTAETPTAEVAISHVFARVGRAGQADRIAKRLDYVIRETASIYGDYAFLTHKAEEGTDEAGEPSITYKLGISVHGWAMQVQCGALWDLSDSELSLLKHNPDDFQVEWYNFNIKRMVEVRQNSKTLWRAQEIWRNRVDEMLVKFKERAMDDEDSPRRNELMGLANILRDLKGVQREKMLEALGIAFNEFEVTFIVEQADR